MRPGIVGAAANIAAGSTWDVSTASYDTKFKLISDEETSPTGLTFSSDGTKLYVIGGTDYVYQYTVNTAWDVSTASYASKSAYIGGQDTQARDVTFSPDGTKMYIVGNATDTVYQYTLDTAWDLGDTVTYASKLKDVSDEDSTPLDFAFSTDGTKMYIMGYGSDTVYQYTLSTAWDVSTASYASKSAYVNAEETTQYALTLSDDGTKMYVAGITDNTVYQYTLSTAWDVSTASYASKFKDVEIQEGNVTGVVFGNNGFKMYVIGLVADTVFQYSID